MSYANPNVLPSGTTFAEFQQGGASGQLERLIAVNSTASANPTVAATLSATGGGTVGGLLAPGVYYVNFTESDGVGETTLSAEAGPVTVAAQAAPTGTPTVVVSGTGGTLQTGVYRGKFTYVDSNLNASGTFGETTAGTEFSFTQTSGAEPVVTINDGGLPSWASGRNLYLTAAGGATNTEVLAFTGITATAYTIATTPAASTVSPPVSSTTTTNIPKITAFPALQTGNSARNIYLTPPNGGSGSEVLYYRESTASTFTFSTAAPASNYAVAPPTSNTTGYSVARLPAHPGGEGWQSRGRLSAATTDHLRVEPWHGCAPGTDALQPEASSQRHRPAGSALLRNGHVDRRQPGPHQGQPTRHRRRRVSANLALIGITGRLRVASRPNIFSTVTGPYRPVAKYQSERREQTMANVERGVVKPPNLELQGLAATRSAVPRAEAARACASNSAVHAGDPGGSADLTRQPSPVAPINQRFNVDNARMPQPPAAVEPGKGAVPVNPFGATEPQVVRAIAIADDAKQR